MTFHESSSGPTYDAIIAGAGPVGLFLACELAQAGCSVLVLEKATEPDSPLKHAPFGIRGLNTPSVEALDRRGLLAGLTFHERLASPHSFIKQGSRRQVGHFAGIPFLESNIDTTQWPYRLPSSLPNQLMTEMAELETLLAHRAETLGVTVRRGLPVIALQQTESAVTISSGEESFTAQWLIGCDGSRSAVRKLSGFTFSGTEPEFTGYSLQLDLADPEKLLAGRHLTETGMYWQSQPGYLVMLEFDGGAGQTATPLTLEQAQAVLRRVSGTEVTLTALHSATTWTDRARQATAYRNGRIFLAGDAAHIHAPLGGQGLNLGLGDAMNLGWKLAATIHGTAHDGLLDTYFAERHPLGVRVLDWSRAQVAVMKPDPGARAMNGILRELMETRDGATYFAGRVWGVTTHYDLGEGHALLGHSAPNFAFTDGRTLNEQLRSGQGLLLDFTNTPALKALAKEHGLPHLHAATAENLGLAVLLVRPDGYVAYASDTTPDEAALRQALAAFTKESQ